MSIMTLNVQTKTCFHYFLQLGILKAEFSNLYHLIIYIIIYLQHFKIECKCDVIVE